MRLSALPVFLLLLGCSAPPWAKVPAPGLAACDQGESRFGFAEPEAENVNVRRLVGLTEWIRDSGLPILSVLISKNNHVVYEAYTSGLERDQAHFLMSVTKSVTSALVGAAIDRKLISGVDAPVTTLIPSSEFPDPLAAKRFAALNLREVMGMSALDAPIAPMSDAPGAKERMTAFASAPNRLQFALREKLLPSPGKDFLYTDVTPTLAVAAVQYAAQASLLDFANRVLFEPMEFRNQEWGLQDSAGFDNGAYGLRLRPLDMQKFGILYLNSGCWNGKRLLSSDWVKRTFTPWIRSGLSLAPLDYGWFWWFDHQEAGWSSHSAAGHRGQRIMIFPEKKLVVTMTAIFKEDSELPPVFHKMFHDYIGPAVESRGQAPDFAADKARLKQLLEETRNTPSRIAKGEWRVMIPREAPYERHRKFTVPGS